jgi:hypothetical protein
MKIKEVTYERIFPLKEKSSTRYKDLVEAQDALFDEEDFR